MKRNQSTAQNMSKKKVIWKSFRLFDFHVADTIEKPDYDNDDASDDESSNPSSTSSRKIPDRKMTISMYGINEKGETACIMVHDYKPFFYIKVANHWGESERIGLLEHIRDLVGKTHSKFVTGMILERHRDLYSFSAGEPVLFARIEFTNMSTMNKVRNLWFSQNIEPGKDRRQAKEFRYRSVALELFESNIPPLLRCFHIHEISPSGWVSIPGNRVVKQAALKKTSCTYEFVCGVADLHSQLEKEAAVPYNICSYDIEASSSHGDFPVAKKNYKRLAMQMVDGFAGRAGFMERGKLDGLIAKMGMAAFGVGSCEGIDRVYPKVAWPVDRLEKSLQEVVAKLFEMDERAYDRLNRIDSYFRVGGEDADEGAAAGGEADDEEEEAAAEDECESDNEDETAPVTVDIEAPQKKPTFLKMVVRKTKQARTLVDYLLEEADRNKKIGVVCELLDLLLPPLQGDEVTFIGSTFLRYGSVECYKKVCYVLGDECGEVDGCEIRCFSTERELLLGWSRLMREADPDIVIGYNIFGFDYEFLFQRAQENGCAAAFLELSRVRGHVAAATTFGSEALRLECKKISIASGPFDMRFPPMIGRFQIDLYTYFRREFNLSSYKLDDVATEFISDKVDKVETLGKFATEGCVRVYSRNLRGLSVGDYVHFEVVDYTSDYLFWGRKFSVVEMGAGYFAVSTADETVFHEVAGLLSAKKTVRWGLAKDDVTPQDIFRLSKGSAADKARVAKYCIQDCNIVHQLLLKIDVLTSYSEMSRICHVPMSYLVFRGQGIKLTSCLAKFCRMRGTLMPDLTSRPGWGMGSSDYEGAIVLPPKCGIYIDDPVSCNDYSSLYPSIIISNNLSQDSKVWTKEFDLDGKVVRSDMHNAAFDSMESAGYRYLEIEFDNFVKLRGGKKKVVGKTVCRWAQFPDGRRGVIPAILETVLKARKMTRKQAEIETDDFMKNILDKRQLAYKITANSIYGQCGSRTSTFYDKHIAASTTAVGRKMIVFAKTMLEDTYGDRLVQHPKFGPVQTRAEYVYGDTDSVFMTFHLTRGQGSAAVGQKIVGDEAMELTVEFSKEVARLCTENLERPMELSYEKTFKVMILLSKKRYAGLICEEDIHKLKLKFMGLSLKRRDNCDYLKDVYGGVLNCFLFGTETSEQKIAAAVAFLQKALDDLLQGRVAMEKLTITKALRDYYKNPSSIAHAVLAARIGERDPGNRPKPGDRIRYVFIETPKHLVKPGVKLLQGDCIETPEFVVAGGLKLNYHYYVTNQIMKPLLQLLGLAVEDILRLLGKRGELTRFRQDVAAVEREVGDDLELFAKKREKLASKIVQAWLFDPVLIRLSNKKAGVQSLRDLWSKTKE